MSYHGVFAGRSKWLMQVIPPPPQGQESCKKHSRPPDPTLVPRHEQGRPWSVVTPASVDAVALADGTGRTPSSVVSGGAGSWAAP